MSGGGCDSAVPEKVPVSFGQTEIETNTGLVVGSSISSMVANLENKEPEPRTHNTRGRNGIKKQKIEMNSSDNGQEGNSEELLINSCAVLLASLDRRACGRLLLKDANAVLEEIIQPMTLPWTHRMAPFMRIPRDIEDLPSLQAAESLRPRITKQIKSNVNKKDLELKASRSRDDPGKIQLRRFVARSLVQGSSFRPSNRISTASVLSGYSGASNLEVFQELQKREEVETALETRNVKITNISFRLANTSSKSTIFDVVDDGQIPLILPAVMPRIVQEGKRKRGDIAFQLARELGSYNCRVTPIQTSISSPRPRTWVGRTRLMWSGHELPHGLSQRGHFKSIITGERLENNAHKRPLHVRVAVQVDGRILATSRTNTKKVSQVVESAHPSSTSDQHFSYSSKFVTEALDRSLVITVPKEEHSQCSLNIDIFHSNVEDDFESDHKSHFLDEILREYEIMARIQMDDVKMAFLPPRLDCVTTEDGIVSVACSKPGSFQWHGPYESGNERIIFDYLCANANICQKCFEPCGTHGTTSCSNCFHTMPRTTTMQEGLLLPSAVDQDGKLQVNNYGKSDRCCSICNLDCGILVWDDSKKQWSHNVCIMWTRLNAKASPIKEYIGKCHLCSTGSSNVTRCAAENCNVAFHPMCAVLASATAQVRKSRFESNVVHDNDSFLCTQYELLMVNVTTPSVENKVNGKCTTIPVAFCGYHNPRRKADHFGWYPGCCFLEDAMRIPPRREKT